MTAATSRLRRRGIGAGVAALVGLTGLGTVVPAQALPNFEVARPTSTENRYATAASIATDHFTSGASTVIVVNGDNPIDALAASFLAGKTTPILYVKRDSVPEETSAALDKLNPSTVWVVGGTNAVSNSVYTAVGGDERVDGANRYETAVEVAKTKLNGATPAQVFLVTGTDLADALAIAPVAARSGIPILLTNSTTLSPATLDALAAWGTGTRVTIVGGTNAVSQTIEDNIKAAGHTVARVAGANRADTSVQVANGNNFSGEGVWLVNGLRPVDALAASVVAADQNYPIVFTADGSLGSYAEGYLSAKAGTLRYAIAAGGTSVLPETVETAAETAGRTVVTRVVTSGVTSGSFTFANPTTAANTTATPVATDTFSVNGVPATLGAFLGQVSVGDFVEVVANEPTSGATTWRLTNRVAADTTSGLVGNVDSSAPAFDIIEPITGTSLRTFSGTGTGGFPAANTFYTVGGTNATQATFLANLNEGDSISVTGAGTTASPYTYALTNQTVSGTVASATPASSSPYASTFSVKTAAGATLGDVAGSSSATDFTVAPTDVITIDGTTATPAQLAAALSVGDTVTYSFAGGVQTIALRNAAPTPVSGTYLSGDASGSAAFPITAVVNGASATISGIPANTLLTVNGNVATVGEFNAATTPGDSIRYQAADAGTSTGGTLSVTDAPLTGNVSAINTSTKVLTVSTSGTSPVALATGLSYTAAAFFDGNTTVAYSVNGTTGNVGAFETELGLVGNGSKNGAVTVSDSGTTTTFALTTTTNATAPAAAATSPTSTSTPGTAQAAVASSGALTLPFNKPVYWSAAPAQGDFALTGTAATVANPASITSVSPTFASNASNVVSATLGASQFTTGSGANTLTVTLTAQGAAKIKDANGVAAAAGTSWTITTS